MILALEDWPGWEAQRLNREDLVGRYGVSNVVRINRRWETERGCHCSLSLGKVAPASFPDVRNAFLEPTIGNVGIDWPRSMDCSY